VDSSSSLSTILKKPGNQEDILRTLETFGQSLTPEEQASVEEAYVTLT
jgi:ethanolamine-phosphate cytidylyltransferase